jgi:hypothetical protein
MAICNDKSLQVLQFALMDGAPDTISLWMDVTLRGLE